MKFEQVSEYLKPLVLKDLADKVLNGMVDISSNILSDELRKLVINRIVERINNGELDRMDIPTSLYEESGRIRAAISNWIYRKMMDGVRKYAEDTEDTVSINFEFEANPEIDTDTVNVHVHTI
jgi:DNA-binding HxlR family transcriptional regulator